MNSSVISEYSCRDKSESKDEKKCRKLAVKEQKKVRNCFFTCALIVQAVFSNETVDKNELVYKIKFVNVKGVTIIVM